MANLSQALIFANGVADDGPMVQRVLSELKNPLTVAADGGARLAQTVFNITPQVVIGDFDSLTESELDALKTKGTRIIRHSPEKDETDLELAIQWAVEMGARQVFILGALGRRIDQTLGNLYLLALPILTGVNAFIVANNQQIRLAYPGTHVIEGEVGDTLSLLPFRGDVQHIYSEGLKYPLHNDTLKFGPARGMSNVLLYKQAVLTFDKGVLLIVHTLGRAE